MNPKILQRGMEISLILYALSLPLGMSAANISLGLMVCFSLAVLLSEKRIFRPLGSFYTLLLFFLWAAATRWVAQERIDIESLNSLSKIWNVLAMIFIPAAFIAGTENVKKILYVLLASGSTVALLGLMEYLTGVHLLEFIKQGRFCGFQSHPLHSGGLYCILFLTALSFALRSGSKKFFLWSTVLALGLAVILTRSRSYYLASVAGALFLLSCKGVKPLIFGSLIGGFLVLVLAQADRNFSARLSTLSVQNMDESAKIRLRLWRAAGAMIQDHPFSGVGYREWKKNILNYSKNIPNWNPDPAVYAHAHSSYLTFAAETGIFGLLLFLSFWTFLILEQIRYLCSFPDDDAARPLILATLASLIALLVAAFFEHNLLTATISLSLFFLIGLSRAAKKQPI